ncbi:hypothetical protein PMAYCL1PPCAC_28627 [Pristionchus mayeri]|uniref:Uncharacterized protein n=1 Tax=Pristionchus mayeri TaxID=1317129 RepID=A0AAN5DA55_9BILA|nr:hypothetical protein PMAYCL1PPCAC_28627 [Pristionchus mayeri]
MSTCQRTTEMQEGRAEGSAESNGSQMLQLLLERERCMAEADFMGKEIDHLSQRINTLRMARMITTNRAESIRTMLIATFREQAKESQQQGVSQSASQKTLDSSVLQIVSSTGQTSSGTPMHAPSSCLNPGRKPIGGQEGLQSQVTSNGQGTNVQTQTIVGGIASPYSPLFLPNYPNGYQTGYLQGQGHITSSPYLSYPVNQPLVGHQQQLLPGAYSIYQGYTPGYTRHSTTQGWNSIQNPAQMATDVPLLVNGQRVMQPLVIGTQQLLQPTGIYSNGLHPATMATVQLSNSQIGLVGSNSSQSSGSIRENESIRGTNGKGLTNIDTTGQISNTITPPSCREGPYCSIGLCLCVYGPEMPQENGKSSSGISNPGATRETSGVIRGDSTCSPQMTSSGIGSSGNVKDSAYRETNGSKYEGRSSSDREASENLSMDELYRQNLPSRTPSTRPSIHDQLVEVQGKLAEMMRKREISERQKELPTAPAAPSDDQFDPMTPSTSFQFK